MTTFECLLPGESAVDSDRLLLAYFVEKLEIGDDVIFRLHAIPTLDRHLLCI
jgi:hypothetical protein